MRKVLISFLGTANEHINGKREYRTAKYRLSDGKEYNSTFLASVLKDYFDIDTTILVGTVKSMWEEVYRAFSTGDKDEDYYVELGDYCYHADHKTPLELPDINKLSSAIGPQARVVLIHYGLTKQEVEQNQAIILELERFLKNNDEVYVDITHSFRSLPLFLLNALIYIHTVSNKRITIKQICYGMFEASKELGFTPVVELEGILDTVDWIVGAYAFKEYGNAYKISEILSDSDRSTANILAQFSNMMNLNHLFGIQHQTRLHSLINKDYPSGLSRMVLQPIVSNYCRSFRQGDPPFKLQFNIAEWHASHHNYSSAFIAAQESMISYICFLNNWVVDEREDREKAKKALFGVKIKQSPLSQQKSAILQGCFKTINQIRNSIAHSIPNESGADKMIRELSNSINFLRKVLFM